ncbi:hypothetical protein [Hydromonas duriensis]|uniref:Uncharacterized protein n=1 Tax=Hydromonas duriensis TaxID=1527608 RepID=A0A4R6Y6A6_9BURK|nr:hypothetical protein [Hydromonas duriensis]TDR30337.1 hypothetical protein DFR44_1226 [Hydromonas duriensis]
MIDRTYPQQAACAEFVEVVTAARADGATFDDAIGAARADMPEVLLELGGLIPDFQVGGQTHSGKESVYKATMDGIDAFTKAHGRVPTGDVIENALRTSLNVVSQEHRTKSGILATYDDATSTASGSPMQSNRAQVAVYQSIVGAVPFAGYIPMGDGLQGKLIIVKHEAASTSGAYMAGENMDGMNINKPFMSSTRRITLDVDGKGLFRYSDSDKTGAPIYASGVDVFIDGVPAGGTVMNAANNVAKASLLGNITLANGINYAITGYATPLTGEIAVTVTPALPKGAVLEAAAILNYEHASMKEKRPMVQTAAYSFDFRAHYMSGNYRLTQEAKVQFQSETRIDAGTEAMYQLRAKSNAERHAESLKAMYAIAKGYTTTFDFMAVTRQMQRSRADIWSDAIFPIAAADADMVERTQGFGISVLYVGKKGKSDIMSLPSTLFTPSGLPSSNGIYRLGKLYGLWDVYYDAGVVIKETDNAIEILAIGRSDQIARNPMIFGDVAGATVTPLAAGNPQEEGYGYFQALATRVNPHQDSARGAARIQLTNFN